MEGRRVRSDPGPLNIRSDSGFDLERHHYLHLAGMIRADLIPSGGL